MTEWAERHTIQFECVKVAMSQDRNGHILKLAIHPNDLPKDLVLDPLGARYVAVLARLNDQDEILQPREKTEGEKAVASAGLLSRNDRFAHWLFDRNFSRGSTQADAEDGIRTYCSITSRAELATNEDARRKFIELRDAFDRAYKRGEIPK